MIFEGTKNQFFFGLGLTRAGKNLPDMTMLGSIAETLQVSCDELLNPEKTLERLANPEPQKGETEETDMKGYTFLNVE